MFGLVVFVLIYVGDLNVTPFHENVTRSVRGCNLNWLI